MRQLILLLGIWITVFSLPHQPSFADNSSIPQASNKPLELDLLANPTGSVVTANTIYQEHLTVPSLWLAKENSENKLLDNWIAYPVSNAEPARVDLLVNQQIWSLLDYLERYDFVNRLGTVARNYGYNVRVFNYQKERLATYTCNFSASPVICKIDLTLHSKLGVASRE